MGNLTGKHGENHKKNPFTWETHRKLSKTDEQVSKEMGTCASNSSKCRFSNGNVILSGVTLGFDQLQRRMLKFTISDLYCWFCHSTSGEAKTCGFSQNMPTISNFQAATRDRLGLINFFVIQERESERNPTNNVI